MNTRLFPKAEKAVSEIGLGCWQLGGGDWGDLDEASAFKILETAVESGINFFDTADVYGGGRSETLIGRFLRGRTDSVFVATKLGRTGALYPDKYTREGVHAAIDASLERLGVEALDLVQLHCVPIEILRRGDIFLWLWELQVAGKIKNYGASVESMEEALICLQHAGVSSLQIIFNIFRQKPIEAVLPKAKEEKVAVIVRLPLASGLLSGKMTKQTQFSASDHRNYNRDGNAFNVGETFAGLPFEKGVELADELKPLVPPGMTMAQMAQRWILDHDAVTTVITGATKPGQVSDNAAVSAIPPLSAELSARLDEFYRASVASHIRGPY